MASVAAVVGIDLVTNPVQGAAELPGSRALGSIADAASELLGGNRSRRRWSADNRCWIEVRGLGDTAPDGRLGELVTNKLRAQPGVRSVKLNFPLSRVVVRIDTDVTSAEELCDIVEVAEREASQEAEEAARHIDLPADAVVLAASTAAAAASAAGLVLTLVGRSLLWPRLPAGVAAAVTLVDYQPRLRRLVEGRLGTDTADTALAFAASVSYTLTQAPASLAVDLVMHLARAAETQSAAAAWRRRELALAGRV
jgi:H+-transporting ATPase